MSPMSKTRKTLFSTLAVLALLVAWAGIAGAAPEGEPGIGLPRDVSVDGHRIDWLIKVTIIFTGFLFVVMCIWMFTAAIFHSEKRDHKAIYDHGNDRKSVMRLLILASAVFLIVDGNLFINSTIDVETVFWNFKDVDKKPDTVRIMINAHQWAWDARYAGNDGEFGTPDDIVTLNDIRVPVNRPVLMQLASVDVIHSFYLPNFRVKQDAMPGMINKMWFQAKETGEYAIGCTQHCGVNHYLMKGVLTVHTEPDFATWYSEQSTEAKRKTDEAMRNGPTDLTLNSQWAWNWEENI